jgi:hypothetical protein
MRTIAVFALALAAFGCGPDRVKITKSRVETLAADWDGTDTYKPDPQSDAWGKRIAVKAGKDDTHYHLSVRSAGADGLPHTSDDIVATREVRHKSLASQASGAVSEISGAATRGATKGAFQGVRDGVDGLLGRDEK